MKTNNYYKQSKEIRKKVLEMHFLSKVSHIGSALSYVDILVVLYFKILLINAKKPLEKNRDKFILSKGHAVSALYAVLAAKNFFPEKLLNTFCQKNSKLPGHPTLQSVPGIEASTGSLGHGLPIGVGMALANKMDNNKSRVFVLISDGECQEGTTWEATLFSAHHKLNNLIVIIDYNKFQALGKTNEILNLEPLKDKWTAFGWHVQEIDGHNFKEIEESLAKTLLQKNKPSVIIAHTIKGKGVSFMENQLIWHYKSPNAQQYKLAIEEIKK